MCNGPAYDAGGYLGIIIVRATLCFKIPAKARGGNRYLPRSASISLATYSKLPRGIAAYQ